MPGAFSHWCIRTHVSTATEQDRCTDSRLWRIPLEAPLTFFVFLGCELTGRADPHTPTPRAAHFHCAASVGRW
jgi:hypothetical protein